MNYIIVANFGPDNEPFYLSARHSVPARSWYKNQIEWTPTSQGVEHATKFVDIDDVKRWVGAILHHCQCRAVQIVLVGVTNGTN